MVFSQTQAEAGKLSLQEISAAIRLPTLPACRKNLIHVSAADFKVVDPIFLLLGLAGATIEENNPFYVVFKDPLTSLQKAVNELKDESDAIVAITHLDFWDDMTLAKSIPELDLIIGGHDHENMLFRRGENFTPIAKADANAKTAFVHRLTYDPETEEVSIESTLVQINV